VLRPSHEQRLTLYRRHIALCLHEYPTDDRIYDPESDRHDLNRLDCNCPIVVFAKLKNEEGRILHRSTGTKDWNEARRCRDLWLSWGQSTTPDARTSTDDGRQELANQTGELHAYAERMGWMVVADFHDQVSGRKSERPQLKNALEAGRKRQYDVLLFRRPIGRLFPFSWSGNLKH
jgi:hypothetical protein